MRPSSSSRRIVRSERTTPRFYEGQSQCLSLRLSLGLAPGHGHCWAADRLGYARAVATTKTMTTKTTKTIELRTAVPGPRSSGDPRAQGAGRRRAAVDIRADRRRGRERRHAHRRRREHVHRLHGRRRLPRRRPRASPRRRGGAGADAALRAHGLHRRAVRGLRGARRAALRAHAGLHADEGSVLQLRRRGGRERREVRARPHEAAGRDRVRRRLSRAHAARRHAHVEDAPVQGRPRPVRARGLPCAVRERLSRP